MKKKIILLNISKSLAEIDWILPVLYELKSKYKIITIFQNPKIYETLQQDKILFPLWKKISFNHSIDSKINKIFRYFIKKTNQNYNIKNYLYKKNIDISKIKILLSEFGTYSWLFEEIKKFDKKKITIHFPTSSFIFGLEKKNIKIKYKLNGDYLLLCNKLDINFWEKRIEKNKIKIVGVPKYDVHWLKKLIKKKKNSTKNKILLAYSSRFNLMGANKEKLENQLVTIMEVLKKLKNCKVIFKIHPRKNDPYYLNILNRYEEVDWEISNENILSLASDCNLLLHDKYSSVIHEGLAIKKPCIEYWDVEKDLNTIYAQDYLKLNVIAINKDKLYDLIMLAIKNPKSSLWKRQIFNFKKNSENFTISASKYAAACITKIDKNNS